MYYELSWLGDICRVSKDEAIGHNNFFTAPSKTAIWKAGVRKVEGECAGNTLLSEIKMRKRGTFLVGDPLEFKGTPQQKVVKLGGQRYLRMRVNQQVTLFVWIVQIDGRDRCLRLQPL